MLLFWPCAWGLTLAYDFKNSFENYLFLIFLFFSGSVLMRSAGCIINDIADMDFDKNVERTKSRPLASGKIKIIGQQNNSTIKAEGFKVFNRENKIIFTGKSSLTLPQK